MRPLYALTFQIDGDRIDDLVGDIRDWIASKYAGWDQVIPRDATPLSLGKPGHEARLSQQDLPSGRMFSFILAHPDWRTDGLHWHTSLTVATDGEETECDVVLSTYVTRDGVQPPPPWQVHPPFLSRIVDRYPLRIGKEPLALKPDTADVESVDALADILLMPQRRLPLVLVSEEIRGGPLVSPASLQKRLLGSARVVHITTAASYRLSDRFENKRLSCYDGGVRIYWPGFQLDDDEYFHKLYLKWEIRDIEDSGRSLANDIFDRITTTTSIRVRPGPLLQRLRSAQEQAKEAEFKRRLAEIGARETVTSEDREAYEELLTEAAEDKDQLLSERDSLLDAVAEKERETEELRWKLHAARDALNSRSEALAESESGEPALRLSQRARSEYADHVARQPTFDRLLERILDPVVRDSQASRCPGGGYVYPRGKSDERVFFEVDEEVIYVCALFPHHQDSLASAYNDLRNNGVRIGDFDGFELWVQPV